MKVFLLCYEYINYEFEEHDFDVLGISNSRKKTVDKLLELISTDEKAGFKTLKELKMEDLLSGEINFIELMHTNKKSYCSYYIKETEMEI